MKLKIRINWKLYDAQHNLINEKEHDANSLVIAFIKLLAAQFNPYYSQTIIDTSGVSRTVGEDTITFSCNAAVGNVLMGIRVGTGITAVTIDDNALITPIAEGGAATQLNHGAMSFSGVTVDSGNRYFSMQRTLANNSGGDITIEEVALYVRGAPAVYYFMVDRTLSTYIISNTFSADVTYKFNITL